MTAKSEMVCYRLLTLDGKGRLIVIRYGCLWQNYPAQVLVNLFVPTYITAPLRTNQKYVYKKRQLQVHKIRSYAKYSDLYTILYQRLTKAFLKGALLHCKRASFTLQKTTYYSQFMNLYYSSSNALFPFITSEYLSPCIVITTP